jgi:hypothetical protein
MVENLYYELDNIHMLIAAQNKLETVSLIKDLEKELDADSKVYVISQRGEGRFDYLFYKTTYFLLKRLGHQKNLYILLDSPRGDTALLI